MAEPRTPISDDVLAEIRRRATDDLWRGSVEAAARDALDLLAEVDRLRDVEQQQRDAAPPEEQPCVCGNPDCMPYWRPVHQHMNDLRVRTDQNAAEFTRTLLEEVCEQRNRAETAEAERNGLRVEAKMFVEFRAMVTRIMTVASKREAGLRARLETIGATTTEWGVWLHDSDGRTATPMDSETKAEMWAAHWRRGFPDANPTVVQRTAYKAGPWARRQGDGS